MNIKHNLAILGITLALMACGKHDDASTTATEEKADSTSVSVPDAGDAAASVSITKVGLGNAVGADKHVVSETSSLAPNDTIYAVVETAGTGKATLKAKWTYVKDGDVKDVEETTQDIEAVGPASTEFHISKNDGWPAGNYKVEVFINDKSNGAKEFTVK